MAIGITFVFITTFEEPVSEESVRKEQQHAIEEPVNVESEIPVNKESAEQIQIFAELLKNEDVEEFNELRYIHNGKLEFKELDLSGIVLKRVNLSQVIFVNSNLTGTSLGDANLPGMTFSGLISDSDLTGADLTNVIFVGANLTNAI